MQGLRYTICETARREVLDRLLRLNHERYADDVKSQRFGKTGSRVLLGMYISGVKYAQELVNGLRPTTKARYLQKAKDLSRRKRGRPVDTQKQQQKGKAQ
jgi:hypothetical protein